MSKTLYSKRMGKEIARLNQEERTRRIGRRAKEIARANPQSRQTKEEENMHGELQTFDSVKTCGDLWG